MKWKRLHNKYQLLSHVLNKEELSCLKDTSLEKLYLTNQNVGTAIKSTPLTAVGTAVKDLG
ncbi:hypothetical protein TorRG33x02_281040 [Trema orientale]|uniref:Uncharacterized protein n=1 Tax=Trema orientale TaxID=63057 RepID=A0A2P5CL95_TREOI|nr:hypothetical protein TorRG33x02_281040 [Trema orientale]